MKRKQIEHRFGANVGHVIAWARKHYWSLGCTLCVLYTIYTLHVAVSTFLIVSKQFVLFTDFFAEWAIGNTLS